MVDPLLAEEVDDDLLAVVDLGVVPLDRHLSRLLGRGGGRRRRAVLSGPQLAHLGHHRCHLSLEAGHLPLKSVFVQALHPLVAVFLVGGDLARLPDMAPHRRIA